MPVRLKDAPKSQRTRMQHAEWLGNSTALIIVTENDIYLRQSPADEEDIRLTHTGVPGLIYNGITDWLYQGEHLSLSSFPSIGINRTSPSRGDFQVAEGTVGIQRRLHAPVRDVQRYQRRADDVSLVLLQSSYTIW